MSKKSTKITVPVTMTIDFESTGKGFLTRAQLEDICTSIELTLESQLSAEEYVGRVQEDFGQEVLRFRIEVGQALMLDR